MLEDDADVAAYRDAVLWTGALVRLSAKETALLCRRALSRRTEAVAKALISRGLFVIDDRSGALLAVPRIKACVATVSAALRESGLKKAASRLTRAARR